MVQNKAVVDRIARDMPIAVGASHTAPIAFEESHMVAFATSMDKHRKPNQVEAGDEKRSGVVRMPVYIRIEVVEGKKTIVDE